MMPKSPPRPDAARILIARHIEAAMKRGSMFLAVIVSLGGCGPSQKTPDLLGLGQRFLETVSSGDSQRIAKLVVDSVALRRVLALRSRELVVLRAAAAQLALVASPSARADTVRVFYKFPLGSHGTDELAIGFTRRGDQWLVYWVGLPERQ
jgi:hypothetical protein